MSTAKPLDELRRRLGNGSAPGAFAALAEEHRRAGRLDEAVGVCRDALARYPTYVSARVTLGRALLDLGDVQAAIVELEQAVEQAPDNLAAVKALDTARSAVGPQADMADGAGVAVLADMAAGDEVAAPAVVPDAPSLAWLTADPVETPWEVEAMTFEGSPAPDDPPASPEVQSAPDVQLAPEFSAADAATFWDETIYAPVAPVPTEDEEAPEPAVVDDDAGVEFAPVSNGVEPEAAPDGDPLEVWAGFAEAPAQSDGNGWGTLVDASLDEVFGQRAEPDPDPPPNPDPEEEAPPSLAAVAADITEAPDAGDPAAVAPTDDTPSPLRTLEALLLSIRARRAAMGQDRPGVD